MDQAYDDISVFLKKKPSHIFSEIISGVIDSSSTGHPVLIIDTKSNLKLWTEAVKLCFPEKVLSSRTIDELYLDKKGNKLLIIQPSLQDSEELYTNVFARTFDFKKNEFPSLGRSFKYARLAEYGILKSQDLLNSMRDLLSSFSYSLLDEDIDSFCELFLIVSNENNEHDLEEVRSALDFINSYGDAAVMEEIYEPFRPYMEGIIKNSDGEQLKSAAAFAAKAMLCTDGSIPVESAGAMLCDCFDRMLSEEECFTCEDVYELLTTVLSDGKDLFYSFIINKGRLQIMESALRESSNRHKAAFYMRTVVEALQAQGYSWEEAGGLPHLSTLINSCSNILCSNAFGMEFVLEGLKGDIGTGIIAALLKKTDSKEAMEQLVKVFVRKMDSMSLEEQEFSREKLCFMEAGRLIYEEFLVRLEGSDNREGIFEQWRSGIFQSSEEFLQDYCSPAIMSYLKYFRSPGKLFQQCERLLEWLVDKEQYLDIVACQMLVNGIENGLSLDGAMSGKRSLIEYARRLKKEFGIKTVPDMLFFADFGMWLEAEGGGGYSLGTILEGMPSIMFLKGYRLRHFQDWCIPMLMPLVKTTEDHRRLVYAFRAGDDIHEFYQRYIKFVSDFIEQDKLNGYNAFLQFVVYFFYYLKGEYKQSDGKYSIKSAGEMLKEAIYNQPSIFRKKLDMDVRRELKARRLKVPALWVEIIKQKPLVPKKGFMDKLQDFLVKHLRKK